ncbi:unnamed protein product [Haemonchus placei]|uniref:CG-1 domain-containing protein n=1 Tax=Haemonchus placei TaxID=6290 RepID=A0A158QLQ1_HAEPC|nr:unnamed protein product [Haemonchus placei]
MGKHRLRWPHSVLITLAPRIRRGTVISAQYMFCRFDGYWFKMDGYEWKKRREGKVIREDHMKLKNPDYALVHYLNTETEPNTKNIMDKILACIKLNSLNLGQQQLLDQISPIYANMLNQQDIACICEKLGSILRGPPSNNKDEHEGKSRFLSCCKNLPNGPAVVKGAPALNNMVDGMPVRETLTGYSADGRSHSGETQRSSNQDEDMGGTKVLVIGGWYMKGHDYTVMFGERRIPARLIQVGVLSVIVPPASMSGSVPVRVLCNGQVISSGSEFTYEEEQDELSISALRQCMVDRLQIVVHAFGAMDKLEWVASIDEDSVLSLLRSLAGRRLSIPSLLSAHPTLPSRTILHIAAALDYHRVVEHVLAWRRNLPFSREFDPLARDGEGRTPLHMAVAAGHVASARVLVRACRTTVDVLDDRGRTPCDLSCDEQMMRLTARTGERDSDEQRALPKNAEDVEHVTSTALWVLTNGETVTDEHLLRDRHPTEGEARWCDEPLHVEISMDTDVHVPDSPKMADLFEAVTSPGMMLNDGVRAKMALLAQQIIDALPDRIKNDANPLLDEESMSADVSAQSSFAYPDNNPFLSHLTHDCPADWEFQQYFANNHYQFPTEKPAEDVLSSFSRQPSSPSFDHNHLYPNKGANSSYGSSRDNTLESTSFDFDKDLGEFFNMRVDEEEDPIRQRLGGLKLSGIGGYGTLTVCYSTNMVLQYAIVQYGVTVLGNSKCLSIPGVGDRFYTGCASIGYFYLIKQSAGGDLSISNVNCVTGYEFSPATKDSNSP